MRVTDRMPPFGLEEHFARWEFTARHHLTASDAETMTISELLAHTAPMTTARRSPSWDSATSRPAGVTGCAAPWQSESPAENCGIRGGQAACDVDLGFEVEV